MKIYKKIYIYNRIKYIMDSLKQNDLYKNLFDSFVYRV